MKTIDPLPYGTINQDDVMATVRDLSGTYAAKDLYERYYDIASEAGRTPASAVSLGRKLNTMGCIKERRGKVGACWFISQELLLRYAADMARLK